MTGKLLRLMEWTTLMGWTDAAAEARLMAALRRRNGGWSCCGGAEDGKVCGVADGGRLKEKALDGDEGTVAAGLWLISLTAAARGAGVRPGEGGEEK